MTICFITNSSSPYGGNKALLSIIDGISSIDKKIKFIAVVIENGFLTKELQKRGIAMIFIDHRFKIYPKNENLIDKILYPFKILNCWLLNKYAILRISNILKNKYKLNQLIIHSNTGPTTVGYEISKKLKIQHVWHLREYQDLDFNMKFFPSKQSFINLLSSEKNHPIAITSGVKKHFGNLNNVKIIYDGVINSTIRPKVQKKQNQILFLGRIEKTKGLKELLEVIAILVKDKIFLEHNYTLKVAGDGEKNFLYELKKYCELKNISGFVEWMGFVKDPSRLIASSKITIVPSKFEGFGFVTVESLYQGTIVIGRKTGGTKEILQSAKLNKFLFENKTELKKKILEVIEMTDSEYSKFSIKGQNDVLSKYSYSKNAIEVLNHYKKILK